MLGGPKIETFKMTQKRKKIQRPKFIEELSSAYNLRRKNIILLTGDVHGLFWSSANDRFQGLEETLVAELRQKFNLVLMDIASGVSFSDEETEQAVAEICDPSSKKTTSKRSGSLIASLAEKSRHSPLAALTLLRSMAGSFAKVRESNDLVKPLCIFIHYGGALFPTGDFSRLSEIDRQRLILFLDWASSASLIEGPELLIIANEVKTEINAKIIGLPSAAHVEIQLPDLSERRKFVEWFLEQGKKVRFEGGKDRFCSDAAGLTLTGIRELLEVAARTKGLVTRQDVVKEINRILEAQLGEVLRIKYPGHGPDDIVGHSRTREIFQDVFKRCEEPDTAVSAVLVSGPNGGGKTFQLEAYASASGRVVVELTGIRGSYFGETDRLFELLRWHIATFGKILILVDEAHTAFGSIHSGDTHATEKRLAGNIIKMMGDPTFLGKVLWGIMTSRPDELDPDVKSRSPIQIPIFDLQGEERSDFVRQMLKRKGVEISDSELESVMEQTDYYSARDYRNMVAEILAARKRDSSVAVLEVLSRWRAGMSIQKERMLQELIASLHCSYPELLPEHLQKLASVEISKKVEELKWELKR